MLRLPWTRAIFGASGNHVSETSLSRCAQSTAVWRSVTSEMICALFVPTDGEMWLPNCGTNLVYLKSYLNHSTTPSLRTKDGYHFTSLRKICEGEELTVDYRTYGAMRTCPHSTRC